MQTKIYRMAAVDMDCDGPITTYYEVDMPAALTGDEAHKYAFAQLNQTYFGASDFFPITYEESIIMFGMHAVLTDSGERPGVWRRSDKGDRFQRLRDR